MKTRIKRLTIPAILLVLMAFSLQGWGQTNPGDIAFIAFNADGNDDFAIVTLVPIADGTTIWFTDNEWDGDSFNNISEGEIQWTATSNLPAGTVIVFNNTGSGILAVNTGTATGGGMNLGASDEDVFALLSEPSASTMPTPGFLAGISNDLSGSGSTLTGTGLTVGTTFLDFDNDNDGFKYTGSRSSEATFGAYLPLIMNTANWQIEVSDGTLILPISTTAFTITGANSITTGAVATSPFCVTASAGAAGTVAYTSSGTFTGTFTAQLSDASGSFAAPVAIGTGDSPISITIPAGSVSGTGYKIRVVNDNPATTGSESAAFTVINNPYPVTSLSATPSSGQIALSWTNPVGCFEKVIVIGNEGSAVDPDYIALTMNGYMDGDNFNFGNSNSDWSARSDVNDMYNITALGVDNEDYLLYAGTGTEVTITGLTNGIDYHFRVLVVKDAGAGSLWSSGVDVNETPAVLPALVEVIVPQYMQGMNGTNNDRTPVAFRVTLENLLPNATYRYINQVVDAGDVPTTNGAGNIIFVNSDNSFTYTSSTGFVTAGQYGEFTTNVSGSYTGWFITVPTSNARFTPGNDVYFRIRTNDGAGGTLEVNYLTTTSSIKVIHYAVTASANFGTGIYGSSYSSSKDFVALYDNTSGTGRPITSTLIENDGIVSTTVNTPDFYDNNVDGQGGYWGTIIPNVNANGIKRFEYRKLENGDITYVTTDTDGDWNGSNTVNPTGGSTAIVLPENVMDDLTIASGYAINIPATFNLTVNGTLTNNAGSAGLVIESDATGTGSLIHNTDNVPATMQRYITGSTNLASKYYHHVSVPLNSNVLSSQFNGSYLFSFNQGTQTWDQITQDNVTLNNNQGYMIFYPNTSTTYNFVGQLNNGAFVASTTTDAIDEYSLIPNPYPSAIDWDAASGWTKTNLQDAIWIWNPVAQNYASYITGAGTNGGSRYVATGQAFFVKSSAASPVLSMNNNIRLHNAQAFFNTPINNQMLRVRAEANGFSDEAIVRFHADASLNFEMNLDVDKLRGNEVAPQLYTLSADARELSINSVPFAVENFIMPLNFESASEGEISFIFSELNTFEEGASMFLEDKTTGEMINILEQQSYSFNHTAGNDPDRFNLHFFGVTGIDDVASPEAATRFGATTARYMSTSPS
jgi:hypothetical protein